MMGAALVAALAAGLAAWWWVPAPALPRLRSGAPRPRPRSRWPAALRGRWQTRRERRRVEELRSSVPQVCELLAVCLDAGRPPRGALRVVSRLVDGPIGGELLAVQQRIDLGVDEAEAWASLSAVPGYRAVGRDLSRSVRSGLGLSGLLRQHASDARSQAAASAVVAARGVGVRSVVPLMLCFLPAFMLLGVVPLFGAFALATAP